MEQAFNETTLSRFRPIADVIGRQRWRGRLTELMVNAPGLAFVRIAGKPDERLAEREIKSWATLRYFEDLCNSFAALYGIRYSRELPIVGCRTPGGHRYQAVIGPNVKGGLGISIRVKRLVHATWEDFAVAPEVADRIAATVADGRAVVVSGGTGTGKTTFVNMIAKCLPSYARVITVEDTPELEIPNENQLGLLVSRTETATRVGWNEIIDSVLRLNPDVVVAGELSIANAFAIAQLMDTGHESFFTTMHANTPMDALRGFRRRIALGGAMSEAGELLEFLADNVALIVQIRHERRADGWERRFVSEVVSPKELLGGENGRAFLAGERGFSEVLPAMKEEIAAVNAGDPLSPDQLERTAAHFARMRMDLDSATGSQIRVSPVGNLEDPRFFTPEERMIAGARRLGLMDPGLAAASPPLRTHRAGGDLTPAASGTGQGG